MARLKIKTFRSMRSISFVRNDPVNEDFSFSGDDKLKWIPCDRVFDRYKVCLEEVQTFYNRTHRHITNYSRWENLRFRNVVF